MVQVKSNGRVPADTASDDCSDSSPTPVPEDSTNGASSKYPTKKVASLEDRAKIPSSLYLTLGVIGTAHIVGSFWSANVWENWKLSMYEGGFASRDLLVYLRDLMEKAFKGEIQDWNEFTVAAIASVLVGCLLYVLVGAPLLAGLWTGPRSAKHIMHRYMGLAYLIQYGAAWVHYLTNYETAKDSYLPHVIALNGVIQGYSAFFSFKVLPELDDPGYYSDKAVASRSFVHENIFFSLFSVFGSIYYNDAWRASLKNSVGGQIIELMFVFFPYIVVRTFFPLTRFSNAGTGRNSRSKENEWFYSFGVKTVKIFYLWAKYFLGFFINFLVFMDKLTAEQWKFLHGLFLLNVGTISIAVFLHTLRFRKVLPAKLTFSIYLLQIWATFSAIPLALEMFILHKMLCAFCFLGIALNMTRSRAIHAVWCCAALYLIKFRDDIDW